MKPSSRVNPFIRFQQDKKLFRNAIEVESLSMQYEEPLFNNETFNIEVGERIAIIGQNGVGKTTLLENLLGNIKASNGDIKWSENADIAYYAQDHAEDFNVDMTVYDWMYQWRKGDEDEQFVRGILGKLLFSKNDIKKPVKVLSGGEKGRMLFGKIMMQRPNVIIMDEPTNHLDMESIESLNLALENYPGTLFFVSHDREFVNSLATRIIEMTPTGINHYTGTYDEYLASQSID